MRSAERVVDVNIAEFGQAGAERLHFFRISFQLGAVFQLYLAFLLDVVAEVFEQNHIAGFGLGAGGFHFRADAVVEKLHRTTEQFLERFGHGLEREFFDALAIRTPEMAHQDYGRTLVERVADGGQRGFNALGVGDCTGDFVLRDVEIHANQGTLALQIEIFNEQFGHKIKLLCLPGKQERRAYQRLAASKVNLTENRLFGHMTRR